MCAWRCGGRRGCPLLSCPAPASLPPSCRTHSPSLPLFLFVEAFHHLPPGLSSLSAPRLHKQIIIRSSPTKTQVPLRLPRTWVSCQYWSPGRDVTLAPPRYWFEVFYYPSMTTCNWSRNGDVLIQNVTNAFQVNKGRRGLAGGSRWPLVGCRGCDVTLRRRAIGRGGCDIMGGRPWGGSGDGGVPAPPGGGCGASGRRGRGGHLTLPAV